MWGSLNLTATALNAAVHLNVNYVRIAVIFDTIFLELSVYFFLLLHRPHLECSHTTHDDLNLCRTCLASPLIWSLITSRATKTPLV